MPTTRTPRISGVLTEGTTKRITAAAADASTKRVGSFLGAGVYLLLEDGYKINLEGDEVYGTSSWLMLEGDAYDLVGGATRRVPSVA